MNYESLDMFDQLIKRLEEFHTNHKRRRRSFLIMDHSSSAQISKAFSKPRAIYGISATICETCDVLMACIDVAFPVAVKLPLQIMHMKVLPRSIV